MKFGMADVYIFYNTQEPQLEKKQIRDANKISRMFRGTHQLLNVSKTYPESEMWSDLNSV